MGIVRVGGREGGPFVTGLPCHAGGRGKPRPYRAVGCAALTWDIPVATHGKCTEATNPPNSRTVAPGTRLAANFEGIGTANRLDLRARELVVTVGRSPFAEAYGPASRPVCHLIRGVVAGLAEGSFGAPAQAREVECLAMGAETCRFHATTRSG